MKTNLTLADEELKSRFLRLASKQELADLLEVKYSTFVYLLYRADRPQAYKKFEIQKKSGGIREIFAPISTLKILQRKLNHILTLVYRPRLSVHGFVKSRNILSNARPHSRKKIILNIDLKDFFPTIHIGRIIGLFQAKPFNFPRGVAVLLAQICCHEGKLPQGAPTSPILANMICAGLDKDLQLFAKENHCIYTRYADDISFSTTAKTFNARMVLGTKSTVMCGHDLKALIEKHGFEINTKKVRVNSHKDRQSVTGLVVNKFVNIPRDYIREVRIMLYAWEKFGEDSAHTTYHARHSARQKSGTNPEPPFRAILGGKISYIKSIRGGKDPVYRKLLNRYRRRIDPTATPLPVNAIDELKSSLWVIKTAAGYVGTAFNLEGHGLVTCYHVLGMDEKVEVLHWQSNKSYEAIVIHKHMTPDIAVLELRGLKGDEHFTSLKIGNSRELKEKDLLTVAGFPDYRPHDTPQCLDLKIAAKSPDQTGGTGIYVERFTVDRFLLGGMSGSPVVDDKNQVVGIAVHGASNSKEALRIWDYGITPIFHLDQIA